MVVKLPQLLKNVRFNSGDPMTVMAVQAAISAGEKKLGGKGRLLIRKSGTEPLIRVMIEGRDAAENLQLAEGLAEVIRQSV